MSNIDLSNAASVIAAADAANTGKKSSTKKGKEAVTPQTPQTPDFLTGLEFDTVPTAPAKITQRDTWLVRGTARNNVWSVTPQGTIMVGCSGAVIDPDTHRMQTDEHNHVIFRRFSAFQSDKGTYNAIIERNGVKDFRIKTLSGTNARIVDAAGQQIFDIAKALHYLFSNGSLLAISGSVVPLPVPNGEPELSMNVHDIKILTPEAVENRDPHGVRFQQNISPAARQDIIHFLGLDTDKVHEPVKATATPNFPEGVDGLFDR